MDCVFCKIILGAIPAKILKETEHSVALLDAFPVAKGHTLVIPKNHREKIQDMSEDERLAFKVEFRDKVSDKRFAWISPHQQMKAGVPVDELECREGLNLVLKSSNGKALCVKSTTAESMIEKGLAVPAA